MRGSARFGPLLALLVGFAPAAWAQADVAGFYGRYSGTGITQTDDSSFYGFTARDLDVEIGPEGSGFFVRWTTVIRDIRDPEPRRRTSRIAFEPTGRPGFFREPSTAEPVTRGVLRWAQVSDDMLSVFVLLIPNDGGYALQTYDRRVNGDVMALRFVSVRDGQRQREVTGRLERQ